MGALIPTPRRSPKRLQRTAYHEAGHAVAGYALRLPMRGASVVEDEDSWGHVSFAPPPASFRPDAWYGEDRRTEHLLEAHIVCSLAGPAAERRWTGRRHRASASADYRAALDLADYVASDINGEGARRYVAWLEYRAEALVEREPYWAAIEALAAELLARRRLGVRRVRAVIATAIEQKLGLALRRDAEGRITLESATLSVARAPSVHRSRPQSP